MFKGAEGMLQASMASISEDVDGPLAGCLSSLSIGWLEKEAAALQEAVVCEPDVELVPQCPSLFTSLLDVIQVCSPTLLPLSTSPRCGAGVSCKTHHTLSRAQVSQC